jgi:predicted transcriptional regulator
MSISTLIRSDDDFDAWEDELADTTGPARTVRPTRAAQRREAREAIDAERGFRRHRSHEREVN